MNLSTPGKCSTLIFVAIIVAEASLFAQETRSEEMALSFQVRRAVFVGAQCRAFVESYGVRLPLNGLETCNAWCAGFKGLASPELVAIRAKLGKYSAQDVATYVATMPKIFEIREWLRTYGPRGCL